MAGLTGWHLLIIIAVFVLLFGAKRLPDMARAVGQTARIFKGEMKGMAAEEQGRGPRQEPAVAPAIEQPPKAPLGSDQVHQAPHPIPDTTHPPTL